jgi:enterochelin esterase-like enzyme
MRTLLGNPVWTWLLAALASQASACKGQTPRAASWSSAGDALGQRVRDGQVPNISHLRFRSKVLQREVGAVIATPPEYERRAEQNYPVVYVFPGIGGDEWTYLREVTLDNLTVRTLFAQPDTAPILVFANPADSMGEAQALLVLADELVREVDQRFRTRKEARARSLEGFSLGGVTALHLYLQRPDVFGQVVALSSACYLLPSCQAMRARLLEKARTLRDARVLLAGGGREMAQNREVHHELAPLFRATVETVDGVDHDWAALLRAPMLGQRIAEFHAHGFSL